MIAHFIAHWLGMDNLSGPIYGFLSGAAGVLMGLGINGGLAAQYRHRNCEVTGCWRLGRHATAAGHRVCRRHHPDDALTHQDVLAAHEQALLPNPAEGDFSE